MKEVFLNCFFVFSFCTTLQAFDSFDCSFSEQQLRDMTPREFDGLSQEQKVELGLIYKAHENGNSAATKLLGLLAGKTLIFVRRFAEGVPTTNFYFGPIEERKSARGMVLEFTVKAIAEGFVKEVPVEVAKQLLGVQF